MENASKALIIAGALLLAILLISFGIIIIRQGGSIVNNSGMSEAELQMYNEKFYKYQGSQRGSAVKSLIIEADSANANLNNPAVTLTDSTGRGIFKQRAEDYGTGTDARHGYTPANTLRSTDFFNVTMTTDANGRVTTITINKG